MDFSSNGKYLATCADDRTVRIWSTKDFLQREHRSMRANVELDHATLVRFSPDCRCDRMEPQLCLQKPRLLSFPYLTWDGEGGPWVSLGVAERELDSLSTARGSLEVCVFYTARKQRGEGVFLLGKYQSLAPDSSWELSWFSKP